MYAVIFRAEVEAFDATYNEMATRLRSLAIDKYGCKEFQSMTEGNQEIDISYWDNQEQIRAWKQDLEHQEAQQLGRLKWYKSYQVQIVKIIREYQNTI